MRPAADGAIVFLSFLRFDPVELGHVLYEELRQLRVEHSGDQVVPRHVELMFELELHFDLRAALENHPPVRASSSAVSSRSRSS